MIVVIQCAASKRSDAGHLATHDGMHVEFVANPEIAPAHSGRVYARPDDLCDGVPWRDVLLKYNREPAGNPLGLYPACKLYENRIYERLVERHAAQNVYILSAGWGLIRADFLTPHYDITFSRMKADQKYKQRRKTDLYNDFRMLPSGGGDRIVFFGGRDYLPLFCKLTDSIRTEKIVFYNSALAPTLSGCTPRRFETRTRTNWHYECANAFCDGAISI
jgi:hypothetical protein